MILRLIASFFLFQIAFLKPVSGQDARRSRETETAADTVEQRVKGGYLVGAQAAVLQQNPYRFSGQPHFGYFTRFKLHRRTAVQAELCFKWAGPYDIQVRSVKTGVSDPNGQAATVETNLKVPWLIFFGMPVVFRRQSRSGRFAWIAGLRPALVLPFDHTNSITYKTYGSINTRGNPDTDDGVRKYDLGLTAGVEWKLPRRFELDIRFTRGLYDLSSNAVFRNTEVHRNTDLQISLRRFFMIRN